MIRKTEESDIKAILSLASKLDMFDDEGLSMIRSTLDGYFSGDSSLWFTAQDGSLKGVVYCAPEPMTQCTWNVLMLLVDPQFHKSGIGSELMSHVEKALSEKNQRLLIVETSSLDNFEKARSFYLKSGYREEARIKNFYDKEGDKIIFTKTLN